MERVALLRTSGRHLLHRCRGGRPAVVPAAASSSLARRPLPSSFPARGYSSQPGGGARFLAAAAPLHCSGWYWPAATPRLARRLSAPAVSTSPSPVPYGETLEPRTKEICNTTRWFDIVVCGLYAEVMSVSNDDENKVFDIVFRTPPENSTGIPHILEHSVLCGSRKYPLKEPFVELLKGKLTHIPECIHIS
ncbi:hypothetical protein PVAP13_1KG111814 [Panicum virgatum]|uniref:Peptidase M16 N-terminal domain-containing protein n=1 Tax=Panicum virgatum TaxID=38727 RepID=A0A8T0XKE7_PANVG|nr:hypothetical protein PVAP13_1KG111814 [Panicum virgatum]KAG2661912.1 hypothetical protein PVAP13_1KG111814 [Panicum virgatum]